MLMGKRFIAGMLRDYGAELWWEVLREEGLFLSLLCCTIIVKPHFGAQVQDLTEKLIETIRICPIMEFQKYCSINDRVNFRDISSFLRKHGNLGTLLIKSLDFHSWKPHQWKENYQIFANSDYQCNLVRRQKLKAGGLTSYCQITVTLMKLMFLYTEAK